MLNGPVVCTYCRYAISADLQEKGSLYCKRCSEHNDASLKSIYGSLAAPGEPKGGMDRQLRIGKAEEQLCIAQAKERGWNEAMQHVGFSAMQVLSADSTLGDFQRNPLVAEMEKGWSAAKKATKTAERRLEEATIGGDRRARLAIQCLERENE